MVSYKNTEERLSASPSRERYVSSQAKPTQFHKKTLKPENQLGSLPLVTNNPKIQLFQYKKQNNSITKSLINSPNITRSSSPKITRKYPARYKHSLQRTPTKQPFNYKKTIQEDLKLIHQSNSALIKLLVEHTKEQFAANARSNNLKPCKDLHWKWESPKYTLKRVKFEE